MTSGVRPRLVPGPDRAPGRVLWRVGVLCAGAALLAWLAGPTRGPWLSVPLTLVACACARSPRGALAAAASVVVAGFAPSLAAAGAAGRTSPALVAVVVAASAGVLIVVRERLVREGDALRGFALTDPLTRIANRRSLLARAEYEIERHRRGRRTFALVMLDLDGFKALNDRFGHPAGDDLLRDVAQALQRAMRGQDTVARLGGDEFCVLAPETDAHGIDRLTSRIEQAVGDVTVGVQTVRASLGASLFPADGEQLAALLQAADQRLLEAKRRHGRGYRGEQRSAA
jgi:diguanylate cyclase (GGDEF)-like protein